MTTEQVALANELDAMKAGQWVDVAGVMVFRSCEYIYVIDAFAPNDRLTFVEAYDALKEQV